MVGIHMETIFAMELHGVCESRVIDQGAEAGDPARDRSEEAS